MAEQDYSDFTPVEDDNVSAAPETADYSEFTPVDETPVVDQDQELANQYLAERARNPLSKGLQQAVGAVSSIAGQVKDAGNLYLNGPSDIVNRAIQSPSTIGSDLYNAGKAGLSALGSDVAGMASGIANQLQDPSTYMNPINAIASNYLKGQLPASKEEIAKGVEDLKMQQALAAQKEEDLSKSPLPGVSKGINAGLQMAANVGGGEELNGLREAPGNLIKNLMDEGKYALPERAKNFMQDVHDRIKSAAGNKPFIVSKDIADPIIVADKSTKDSPIHYAQPSEMLNDYDKKLLSRSAPAIGDVGETAAKNDKIQNGYAKLFKVNPEGTKDVLSTLSSSIKEGNKAYQEYLNIGNSRPDIQVNLNHISEKAASNLGQLSDPDKVAAYGTAKEAYQNKTVPLPEAIQKLQDVNLLIGDLKSSKKTKTYQYNSLMMQSKELRNAIDPAIEKIGGNRAAELRKTYGELKELTGSLSSSAKKLQTLIPPELRGSMNDMIGSGELMVAGVHLAKNIALGGGLDPLSAAIGVHGVLKKLKGKDKLFWTDANKTMESLNKRLSRKVSIQNSISTPEGWKAPKVQPPPPPLNYPKLDDSYLAD